MRWKPWRREDIYILRSLNHAPVGTFRSPSRMTEFRSLPSMSAKSSNRFSPQNDPEPASAWHRSRKLSKNIRDRSRLPVVPVKAPRSSFACPVSNEADPIGAEAVGRREDVEQLRKFPWQRWLDSAHQAR